MITQGKCFVLSFGPRIDVYSSSRIISSPCANCGKIAMNHCRECSNHPALLSLNISRTLYCSRGCQIQHWPKHKLRCKIVKDMLQYEALRKAADLLQRLFYTYREASFDLPLEGIDMDHDTLKLIEGQRSIDHAARFPHERAETLNLSKEQLLTVMSYPEMMSQFHTICDLVLRGRTFPISNNIGFD